MEGHAQQQQHFHAPSEHQQQPEQQHDQPQVQQEGGGSSRRETGTVKWFNATKGFGFITPTSTTSPASQPSPQQGEQQPEEGPQDLFVHQVRAGVRMDPQQHRGPVVRQSQPALVPEPAGEAIGLAGSIRH
jgi:cold shock CspA family protein